MDGWTDGRTDRQTDGRTDGRMNGWKDRQAGRQAGRQADCLAGRTGYEVNMKKNIALALDVNFTMGV